MLNTTLLKNPINWVVIYLMVLMGYLMFNMLITSISPDADIFADK